MNNPMPLENKPSLSELRSRFHTRPLSEGVMSEVADKASGIVLGSNEGLFGPDGFDADGYDRAGFNLAGLDRFGYRWAGKEGPEEFVLDRSGNRILRSEAMKRHSDPNYALRRYFYASLDIEEFLSCCNPKRGLSNWMDEIGTLNDPESQPDADRRALARALADRLGMLWELDAAMNSALGRAMLLDSEKKKGGKKPWAEKSGKPHIVYHHNG